MRREGGSYVIDIDVDIDEEVFYQAGLTSTESSMAVRPVEEQDCEEEAMEAECEFGARKAEMMRSPSLPSGAEVEEHEKDSFAVQELVPSLRQRKRQASRAPTTDTRSWPRIAHGLRLHGR